MRRGTLLLLAVLLAGAPALLPSPPARAQDPGASYPDAVVAIVEGTPVTRHELELSCRLRSDYREVPEGSAQRHAILTDELEALIQQHLLVHRAQEAKIELTKEDREHLNRELRRQAQPYRGLEGLQEVLRRVGVPFPYFVLRQENNLLVQRYLMRTISRDIFVTPAEIRRYYQENQREFHRAAETRYREIRIAVDASRATRVPPSVQERAAAGTWDAAAFAQDARDRLEAGEPFETVARETSTSLRFDEETVLHTAGSLQAQLIPPLGARFDALQPGEISDVIDDGRGDLCILYLVERRQAGVLPLEEVQERIENALKEQIWHERLAAHIDRVREEAFVQTFLPPPR